MLEKAAVAERIEAQIRHMAQISATDTEFTRDAHVFDYGYLDSFGAGELISFVETEFKVSVTDDDLAHRSLSTVNEIASFVLERA